MPNPLAEATGGAIGAVWSTLLFYPADVAKIRLQAEADAEEEEGEREEASSPPLPSATCEPSTAGAGAVHKGGGGGGGGPKSFLGEVLVVLKRPDLWYAGLGLKLQLAIVSTFVYFYVYTSLKRAYARLFKRAVTFLPNLALASLAGVANVLVTMPMDVVVTRLQVAKPGKQRPTFREMVRVIWEEGHAKKGEGGGGGGGGAKSEVLFWRLARFWHGLLPALILTSNPAINYAVYDSLKALMPLAPGKKHHGPRETFAIGMVSKFVATLITYPLIRAKVMMMADTKRLRAVGEGGMQQQQQQLQQSEEAEADVSMGGFRGDEKEGDGEGGGLGRGRTASRTEAGEAGAAAGPTSLPSPSRTPSGGPPVAPPSLVLSPSLQLMAEERQGLLEIMRQLVREGGIRELYVGLDGQVINTALKNAVLMNTKDRISRVTAFLLRRLFGAA